MLTLMPNAIPAPPDHYRDPVAIGGVRLATRFVLAPLAGYTNYPFRRSIREIGGAGLCTTDLVNARAILEGSKKSMELLETGPDDRPLSVQIFGGDANDIKIQRRPRISIDMFANRCGLSVPHERWPARSTGRR